MNVYPCPPKRSATSLAPSSLIPGSHKPRPYAFSHTLSTRLCGKVAVHQLRDHLSLLHLALLRGKDGIGLYNLGVVLLEGQQIAAAQETFHDAVTISGGDFAALYNYGVTLYLRGRYDEAYKTFR